MRTNFILRGVGISLFYAKEIGINISLFYAYLINVILDIFDCPLTTIFRDHHQCDTGIQYQLEDKIMDLLVDLAALHVALKEERNFNDILLFLFVYRLIGLIIFFITKDEKVLFYFPHFFSVAYLFFFFLEEFDIEFNQEAQAVFVILLFLKLTQEYILHMKGGFRKILKI